MCWSTYKKPIKKKLKVNKTVYKTGSENRDDSFSPYYYDAFIYLRDKPNKKIKIDIDFYPTPFITKPYWDINEGYHSFKSVSMSITLRTAKFIIPKGTTFYQNEYDEIVSENIIYKGVM